MGRQMTHGDAVRLWNVVTGARTKETAFGGAVAASGAPVLIPERGRDFTAGNNGVEAHAAQDFLRSWADAFLNYEEAS